MDLPVVPRLVIGSWNSDHGVGCIMNLKSWEHQVNLEDPIITDSPSGFAPAVQTTMVAFNDQMCTHITNIKTLKGKNARALCSKCTMYLIDMANLFDGSDRVLSVSRGSDALRVLHLMTQARMLVTDTATTHSYKEAAILMLNAAARTYKRILEDLHTVPATNEAKLVKAITRMSCGSPKQPDVQIETKTLMVEAPTEPTLSQSAVGKFWQFVKSTI